MIEARDLDNLSARLHGRRSRLADGERLRSLCALASPAELAGALFPGSDLSLSLQVQRRLAEDFVNEARELALVLGGARAPDFGKPLKNAWSLDDSHLNFGCPAGKI